MDSVSREIVSQLMHEQHSHYGQSNNGDYKIKERKKSNSIRRVFFFPQEHMICFHPTNMEMIRNWKAKYTLTEMKWRRNCCQTPVIGENVHFWWLMLIFVLNNASVRTLTPTLHHQLIWKVSGQPSICMCLKSRQL